MKEIHKHGVCYKKDCIHKFLLLCTSLSTSNFLHLVQSWRAQQNSKTCRQYYRVIDDRSIPRVYSITNMHTDCVHTVCIQSVHAHWGRTTHICVGKLNTIGSDNGLSPGRRQANFWTISGILLIGPLGTNFSEILIGIQTSSFKKMHLKMSSAKWRQFVSALMS